MPRSIRVGDCFDNDDNGVWSWYLSHIRSGDFEEFSRNELKISLLKRFLNTHFGPASRGQCKQNTKILFVSIPDQVHRDLPLLENFLRDYFHLEHLEHIEITRLTQSRVYNHENHYVLIDRVNNFGDPTFLQFASSKWQSQLSHQRARKLSNPASSIDMDQKLCGTVTERSGLSSDSTSSDGTRNLGYGYRREPQFVEVNSIQSESTTEPADSNCRAEDDIGDGDSASVVLNFSHSLLRRRIEARKLAALKEQQRTKNVEDDEQSSSMPDGSCTIYSPPISENVSINSFEESINDRRSYSGQPISLTITRNEETNNESSDESQEEKTSDVSSISESMNSLESATSFGEDCDLDNGSESSDYSVLSILPSISISDAMGHFRLVLQSTLLQNPETKEIYTAIRQSNNQPAVADVEDDWLLYDSHFSMNNLQMLTLQDLLDANRSFPKIIFYSMIVVSDEQEELLNLSNTHNGLESSSQMTLQRATNATPAVPRVNSTISVSEDPQEFYASIDDVKASFSKQSGPQTYAATRVQSNATAGHISVRRVNSIGDWAFSHNSDPRISDREKRHNTNGIDTHAESNKQGIQWLSLNKPPSRNRLSKVSTVGSLNVVERSKSTPLPGSLNDMDGECKHWKDKITAFRRKKAQRGHGNERDCVIM
ncbi:hypothetical protein HG536_0A05450 [Torulaspora globosa]|uniref:Protein GIS4 n=1 Tax=Torulaspora globosa TaxID=48254 RepID=A0A7G3ZB44_9SACH|nr:uncharacterized protein HG536_0A05450 [Torulaspora globosa]QLL30730.1 hypothetical protein HG536_0A05450 [Torulaspora globosa]